MPGTGPTDPSTPAVEIPADAVGSQVKWVLDQLGAGSGPDTETAQERFSDEFLAHVPAEEMDATFAQLRALGPFTPTSYSSRGDEAVVMLDGADDTAWRLSVAIDNDEITTLLVEPSTEIPDIAGWEDLQAALMATGADVSVLAERESRGSWNTVHSTPGSEVLPLGSVFKLYVLGAVQQAVLEGEVSWDDEVTVTAAVRSLPTGELQDQPDGTPVSVAEAAGKMISISDNTATDMLIDLVGRAAVEDAVAAMGHADPALLQPFLTTRELFRLGWSTPELREAWREADLPGRYDLLESLPDGELEVEPQAVTDPSWPDGIEWFATGSDIAEAHRALQDMADDDATGTVRDLLAENPGVRLDPGRWPYVAYKGGAAPGVFALSWYAEDTDGGAYVLVIQLAATEPELLSDTAYIVAVAEQAFTLLGDS
ncbi:serine hydrolase [Phytoactinopolyspora alkaliphila]|uniref:Serine hydrolase n=1 Tax=Phytoactinopolyspora alkaliphila TaxID=1783498 RepID=A0A6N9YGE9_9ACTN|nr:serine hydrolase [Phytoactinopolyspora alkaliphila]